MMIDPAAAVAVVRGVFADMRHIEPMARAAVATAAAEMIARIGELAGGEAKPNALYEPRPGSVAARLLELLRQADRPLSGRDLGALIGEGDIEIAPNLFTAIKNGLVRKIERPGQNPLYEAARQ